MPALIFGNAKQAIAQIRNFAKSLALGTAKTARHTSFIPAIETLSINLPAPKTFEPVRKLFLLPVFFIVAFQFAFAQSPTLGTYTATTITTAGGNAMVTPSIAPTNTASITANTSPDFKGQLQVSPVTGIVRITNAQPAGTYIITIKAFNGVSSATTNFSLTVNNSICSNLRGPGNFTVGGLPYAVAIADINSDGIQDLVTANGGNPSSVSVALGTGGGNFGAAINTATGSNLRCLAVSDFNGDGKPDIAVGAQFTNLVYIRLGSGTGTFNGTTSVIVGNSPSAIAVADFNGDGKPDFATANTSGNSVSVRLGDGAGNFSGATDISISGAPRSIAIADFNNDGIVDIAIASPSATTVAVRLGDGAGNFTGNTNVTVGSSASSIATGDFNGDGATDFVTANSNSSLVSVRLGNGTGSFTGTVSIPMGVVPSYITTGDFNGDGILDFATTNSANTVSVRLGDGAGNFAIGANTDVGRSLLSPPIVCDVNSDGKTDLAIGGYSSSTSDVSVLIGSANEINVQGNGISIPDGSTAPAAGNHTDFGNAGRVTRTFTIQNTGLSGLTINSITISGTDASMFTPGGITFPATIASGASATFTVFFQPASTGLKTAVVSVGNDDCNESVYDFAIQGTGVLPVISSYTAVTMASASGNTTVTPAAVPVNTTNITAQTTANFKGLLHADPATGIVTVTNAHPAGTYTVKVTAFNGLLPAETTFNITVNSVPQCQAAFSGNGNVTVAGDAVSIAVGDLNNDGKQDPVATNYPSGTVYVLVGNGAGGVTMNQTVNAVNYPYTTAIGDINGDGKQDLLIANGSGASVSVRLGTGSGVYTSTVNFPVTGQPRAIAIHDFNNDGKPDFAVGNYSNKNVSIRLGDGTGGFSGTTEVSVQGYSTCIAVADFNNDGKADFVTANSDINSVSVRLGDGTGNFTGTTNVVVGTAPWSVATDDFNSDGNADIAVANSVDNTVSIRLGDGAGNFSGTINVPVGSKPLSVAAGDFNSDGKPDIAAANNISNTVSVRFGDGTGAFSGITEVPVGVKPQGVAIGDFNGDGRQDLVTANNGGGYGNVSIRLGSTNEINVQGNTQNIPDGNTITSTADSTDFGSTSTSRVQRFTIQNTGPGYLTIGTITITGIDSSLFTVGGINLPVTIAASTAATFTINFQPNSIGIKKATVNIINDDCDEAVYDFAVRGEGVTMVATLGIYPDTTLATAGSNATVMPSVVPTNAVNIVAYTSPKFKGVLHVDPATGIVHITNAHPAGVYTITVRINNISPVTKSFTLTVNNPLCSSGFSSPANISAITTPYAMALADFNGDGNQDLAIAASSPSLVSIRLGNGTGGFTGNTNLSVPTTPCSIATGDFNGDGKSDIAVANNGSNNVSIRLGDGTGSFTGTTDVAVGNAPWCVVTADFNTDGKLDLAVANKTSNTVSIRLGDGAGNFSTGTEINVGNQPQSIAVNDYNSDGKLDLAVANSGSNILSIRLGDGAGGFTGSANVSVGGGPYSIATGDLNNDGIADLATVNNTDYTVSVRVGNGSGGFTATTDIIVGSTVYAVAIADFNGDGKQDIAYTNGTNYTVVVRYGDGTGSFTGNTVISVSFRPQYITVGDFNNDGKQDMAVANANNGFISIRLGSSNEINIQGNGMDITDGDNTPDAADFTNFGTVPVDNTLTRTFTIQNTGIANLTVSNIIISGPDSVSYIRRGITFPATIAPNASQTFMLSLEPTSIGLKTALIKIINDDCDEASYDFAVKGLVSCAAFTTNNWLGNTADWNLPGNWSLNFVPTQCTKVVVNTGVPFMPEITSANSTCYSITLNNGATVTVKTGGHLNITANN